MTRFKGFVGPTYQLRNVSLDCQRCVNLYPEINEIGTAANGEIGALVSTPGLLRRVTCGNGPIRGMYYTSTGRLAVVSGNTVYRIGSDWVSTAVGTITGSTGRVGMADNGVQLCIVDGSSGWIVSMVDGSLAPIPDFDGATNVVFQDGYFLANTPGTGQWRISGLYDGFSWDALDFASAESSPDQLLTIVTNNRLVWLFGSRSIEVWSNAGGVDFPFVRVEGATIEYGIAAPWTAVKFANTIIWLGDGPSATGIVWMAEGYQPKRISNHAVEYAIQGYGNLSTATAYGYQAGGHNFYVLNFPSANTSWVFDISTGQWHERAYLGGNGNFQRHRGECYAWAYNEHLVGDYENGKIYSLSDNIFTDDGNPLVRLRRSPVISDGLTRIFYSKFQLDCRIGVGLDGAPVVGVDPQVMLRFSDDRGNLWNAERVRSIGPIGQYGARVIWRQLGQGRNRVYEVRLSDPVPFAILGAEIDAIPGAS